MDGAVLLGDGGAAIAALPPGADPAQFDHGAAVRKNSGWRAVAAQARALMTKNYLVLLRRRRSTLAFVLMPSVAILLLCAMEAGVASWLGPPPPETTGLSPLRVRKCEVFDILNLPTGEHCTTVMFAPDSPNAEAIMRKLATAEGLEYGVDIVGASSAAAISDAIARRPGSVDAAVIFAAPAQSWAADSPAQSWADWDSASRSEELPPGWTESGSHYIDPNGATTYTRPRPVPTPAPPPPPPIEYDDATWSPASAGDEPSLTYELWTNTTGDMGRWLMGDDRHLLDKAAVYGHYEALQQVRSSMISAFQH